MVEILWEEMGEGANYKYLSRGLQLNIEKCDLTRMIPMGGGVWGESLNLPCVYYLGKVIYIMRKGQLFSQTRARLPLCGPASREAGGGVNFGFLVPPRPYFHT